MIAAIYARKSTDQKTSDEARGAMRPPRAAEESP